MNFTILENKKNFNNGQEIKDQILIGLHTRRINKKKLKLIHDLFLRLHNLIIFSNDKLTAFTLLFVIFV